MQLARLGDGLVVVNLHLTPHRGPVEDAERRRELVVVAGRLDAGRTALVAGDFNLWPTDTAFATLTEAGLRDTWPADQGEVFTNWSGRVRTLAANRRLDYLWASSSVEVLGASVPRVVDADYATFGTLSDHLPLTTTLDL
jgi:endonuclease/exonuclease/phosphatase family metal-dependent hydrolase